MFTRTLVVVACALMLGIAACGGDEESGPTCTGTEMSVPNSPNDPCDQMDPACTAVGGVAYAMCENGHWPDKCTCIPPMKTNPITSGGPSSTPAQSAICGDTVITAPTESCDRTNLNGATCQSLGYNGGGVLLCNMTTCTYDTIMCRMTVGTTSGAGTSGGAGMGGGAGSGN